MPQQQYCHHRVEVERDDSRRGWTVTHGENAEAVLFIADQELEASPDHLYGYHRACQWIDEVHRYEGD